MKESRKLQNTRPPIYERGRVSLLLTVLLCFTQWACAKPALKFQAPTIESTKFSDSTEEDREKSPSELRFESARTVLSNHCFKCHGVDSQKGDFESLSERQFLTTRSAELGGPYVVAGKPEESEIYFRLKGLFPDGDMPGRATNRPLNSEEIALLKTWIEQISDTQDP